MYSKKIIIKGQLPTMNEYINANRYSRFKGGSMKTQWTGYCANYIKKDLKENNETILFLEEEGPFYFNFDWYRKNKRSDPDNIASTGMKFIFDGFQKSGVLKNDGWKEIKGFSHSFFVDKVDPRVEITIISKNCLHNNVKML